jgi:hypothetical protein
MSIVIIGSRAAPLMDVPSSTQPPSVLKSSSCFFCEQIIILTTMFFIHSDIFYFFQEHARACVSLKGRSKCLVKQIKSQGGALSL